MAYLTPYLRLLQPRGWASLPQLPSLYNPAILLCQCLLAFSPTPYLPGLSPLPSHSPPTAWLSLAMSTLDCPRCPCLCSALPFICNKPASLRHLRPVTPFLALISSFTHSSFSTEQCSSRHSPQKPQHPKYSPLNPCY